MAYIFQIKDQSLYAKELEASNYPNPISFFERDSIRKK